MNIMKIKFFLPFSILLVAYCVPLCAQEPNDMPPVPSDIFDIFDDDDEDEDVPSPSEDIPVYPEELPGLIISKLMDSKASPVGNWMGDSFATLLDKRDCPQEYLCMKDIASKALKIELFEKGINDPNLNCEERLRIMENYTMFLGTIYLNIYCMDFFNDRGESYPWSDEEIINMHLGIYDAVDIIYQNPKGTGRKQFIDSDENSLCTNDLQDTINCECDEYIGGNENIKRKDAIEYAFNVLEKLHPDHIVDYTANVAEQMSRLPCNK